MTSRPQQPSASGTTQRATGARNAAWLSRDRAEKVPELVARTILREIVQQGLSAGDRLPPEATMLAHFGVGRGSLREGLRILEIHGLIKIKPGPQGGPVVTSRPPTTAAPPPCSSIEAAPRSPSWSRPGG